MHFKIGISLFFFEKKPKSNLGYCKEFKVVLIQTLHQGSLTFQTTFFHVHYAHITSFSITLLSLVKQNMLVAAGV